ncbi:hypothetical protein H4582DRAFT_1340911 [Lactarius indigo]|nr:hypothetical protein H4582DRAFT_1340911 [Lactarius indigo]
MRGCQMVQRALFVSLDKQRAQRDRHTLSGLHRAPSTESSYVLYGSTSTAMQWNPSACSAFRTPRDTNYPRGALNYPTLWTLNLVFHVPHRSNPTSKRASAISHREGVGERTLRRSLLMSLSKHLYIYPPCHSTLHSTRPQRTPTYALVRLIHLPA